MRVFPDANCTPVPGGPRELLGVANLQGEIRSVLDLARLLQLPEGDEESGYLLLVKHHDEQTALRVGSIEGIQWLEPEALTSPRGESLALSGDLLQGIAPDETIILKFESLRNHAVFHTGARIN